MARNKARAKFNHYISLRQKANSLGLTDEAFPRYHKPLREYRPGCGNWLDSCISEEQDLLRVYKKYQQFDAEARERENAHRRIIQSFNDELTKAEDAHLASVYKQFDREAAARENIHLLEVYARFDREATAREDNKDVNSRHQ